MDMDADHKLRLGEDFGPVKRVGVLLVGAGRLAELEGTNSAAVDGYVTAMCYGQEMSRGGVVMERLVGVTVEHVALMQMQSLLPKLAVADARHAVEQLRKLDARHDAPEVNLAADAEWQLQAFPMWQRCLWTALPFFRKLSRQSRENFLNEADSLQTTRRRVIVEAHAVAEEDVEVPDLGDDAGDEPDTLRVWITAGQARAFAERARTVVAAGRPPCPFCTQPLDPSGHICPRANGYRRRP
mgnify:CR=1 FL=1